MTELTDLAEVKETSLFAELSRTKHENVVFCYDEPTGLKAIIGIHSTVLGPALGGTRIWNYANEADAVNDVLRLSRGMTYKNAISGLNLGGGKAVIMGDARTIKTEALMKRFGQFVHDLGGKYITAEDVGVNTRDMEVIAGITPYVSGKPESMGGGGDPSVFTAYGVFLGMKAVAKKAFGSDSLKGLRIAVQGVGHVGTYLLERLHKEGAVLFVTDYFEDKAVAVANKIGASVVGVDDIYDLDIDIYAPCALGATLNDNTIPRLKCKVVAGAANNQLKDEVRHGQMLLDLGIIYAPDFLINAGGVINVYQEVLGYNREKAFAQVEKLYDFTLEILNLADKQGITTHAAAMQAAERRIIEKQSSK
jgi:leucine dehydrogenase